MANDANPVTTPAPAQTQQPAAATPAPSGPIRLSDDAEVLIPGSEKPVKYGEWYRGLQQKITSQGQERGKLAKQLEERNAAFQRHEEELQRLRTALGAPQQPKAPPSQADRLQDMAYLDGKTGHEVVKALEGRLGQFEQAIAQRDQALRLLATKLAEQMNVTGQMTAAQKQAATRSRIKEVMKSLEVPDEAEEFALDLYHSYEGEELEEKYPELLKNRWETMQKLIRAMDKERVRTARRAPFVPGKGGEAHPSSKLDLSRASAKEMSESLWDMVGGPQET
jgi:tetratricopeptide (TPR) repeat protein